ncbi:chemotaxis protein CheR [Oceanobacillus sp. 143]|uniref:protein-glutamate O-methyltransferase n=1 Tax=Oceanobacillus zhaokaii TaxID=2052660 RepID=A0A345PH67_9BACI|nr:protein-glutamate O-methyltransferase CheR [Oceanobacillus zhaokaii]AXI09347.1 chemotaxis protein CheR [Oceanobacillus zhaokaii]QGS68814.1 chemotaxis protein CheR [Oceanobacillus sp. 143]
MEDEYIQFIKKVKLKVGVDLSLYKEAQMKRRITTLRDKRGYTNFTTYYNAIIKEPELLDEFVDRLTINVSEFFRNPKRWEVLKETIIPKLLTNKRSLKIWSAACSTGEEPYSLAIMLKENFPTVNYNIIATDLDEIALSKAKQGIYAEQALKEVPKHYKLKYFSEVNNQYQINSSLKKEITFKKHNLLADKYPANIDLIVCRNVLIYFTDEAKELIYHNFSDALIDDGVLFVGSTEQIFVPAKYNLGIVDTFFYQKL